MGTVATAFNAAWVDGERPDKSTIRGIGPIIEAAIAAGSGGGGSGSTWVYKTTSYTAASGESVLVNASGGVVTITLPASPASGNWVRVTDGAASFSGHHVTVGRNGSTIASASADWTLGQDNADVIFIYNGATWLIIRPSLRIVTPEMFGAVGDGVADDSVPVQSACDASTLSVFFGGKYGVKATGTAAAITVSVSGKECWGPGSIVPLANGSGYSPETTVHITGDNVKWFVEGHNSGNLGTATADGSNEHPQDFIRNDGNGTEISCNVWHFTSGVAVRAGTGVLVHDCHIAVRSVSNLAYANDPIFFIEAQKCKAVNNFVGVSTGASSKAITFENLPSAGSSLARCGIAVDTTCDTVDVIGNHIGEAFSTGIHHEGTGARQSLVAHNIVEKQLRNGINGAGGYLRVVGNTCRGTLNQDQYAGLTGVIGGIDSNTHVADNEVHCDQGLVATATFATNVMTVASITSGVVTVGSAITATGVTAGTYILAQLTGSAGSTGTYSLSTSPGTLGSRSVTIPKVDGIYVLANAENVTIQGNRLYGTFRYGWYGIANNVLASGNMGAGTFDRPWLLERPAALAKTAWAACNDNEFNGCIVGGGKFDSGLPGEMCRNRVNFIEGYASADGCGFAYGGDYTGVAGILPVRIKDNVVSYSGSTSVTGTRGFVYSTATNAATLKGEVTGNTFDSAIFSKAIDGNYATPDVFECRRNTTDAGQACPYKDVTYNPASLTGGTVDAIQTQAFTGVALGDRITPTFNKDLQGIVINAYVQSTDVVAYQFFDPSGQAGFVDLASGTLRLWLDKKAG